jgi:hypothetical protein
MGSGSSSDGSRRNRFLAGLPAVLVERGVEYHGLAHNLSREGALIRGAFPWPAEGAVEVRIQSAGGDLRVHLWGRVVRVGEAAGGEQTEVALEFLRLDDRTRDELDSLVARVVEGNVPASLAALPAGAPPAEIREALEIVPVPHRIALAARAALPEREFLQHDPNPDVLHALARNPTLFVREARALAINPAARPPTLDHLASSRRWRTDEETRHRLLANPRLPARTAEALLSAMDEAEARRLAARPGIPSTLRSTLARRLS